MSVVDFVVKFGFVIVIVYGAVYLPSSPNFAFDEAAVKPSVPSCKYANLVSLVSGTRLKPAGRFLAVHVNGPGSANNSTSTPAVEAIASGSLMIPSALVPEIG